MATGVQSWSKTAATNATADSNVNWAEGMAPSAVNDSSRAEMASAAKFRDDISGTVTTGGTSTAYTMTSNQGFATAAAMSGAMLCFIPHATSGASPTLAVDGLTARAINKSTGVAVPTGALIAGTPYVVSYIHATTEFILQGYTEVLGSPTFTGNLTVNGTSTLTGAVTASAAISGANGLVGTPEYTFTSDPDCGMYRIGANNIGLAVNGAKVLDVATTGLGVTGTFSATGATTLTGGLAAGTTGVAPLQLVSGTNLTTPTAGAIEYDGIVHYATHAASERGVLQAAQWIRQSATYTLTSTTAAQQLFNTSTNGAVTVAGSTSYEFECQFDLTAMSASNGNFGFAIGGAATLTSVKFSFVAQKSSALGGVTNTIAYGQSATASQANITGLTTTTTGCATIKGIICVNAGGTIIPQVLLGVAATAVVGINSFFKLWPIGTNTATTLGNWS